MANVNNNRNGIMAALQPDEILMREDRWKVARVASEVGCIAYYASSQLRQELTPEHFWLPVTDFHGNLDIENITNVLRQTERQLMSDIWRE